MKLQDYLVPLAIFVCSGLILFQQSEQRKQLEASQRALFERIPAMALQAFDHIQSVESERRMEAVERKRKWDKEWHDKQELEAALERIPADVPEPKRTLAARELIKLEKEAEAKREQERYNRTTPGSVERKVMDALRAANDVPKF